MFLFAFTSRLNLKMIFDSSAASLRVTLDLPDRLDLRVRREREDPMVSLVVVDPLVSVEPE